MKERQIAKKVMSYHWIFKNWSIPFDIYTNLYILLDISEIKSAFFSAYIIILKV